VVSPELTERAELPISEIVTDAVRHAAGDRFTIRLEASAIIDSAIASTIELSAPVAVRSVDAGRVIHALSPHAFTWTRQRSPMLHIPE
jgi:hypothetical protein